MLQAPVLFGVPEQIVFDETAVIVAIKGDKGISDILVGHQHDLFIQGRSFVVPGFDHDGIERDGDVVFLGGVGFRPLRTEPVTGQKTGDPDQFRADFFRVLCVSVAVGNVHIPRGRVRTIGFQGQLAGVDSSIHVSLERDDKLDALLINGIEDFSVEEAPIND